jgi:transglutaminase-like putative cysteine protease
VLQVAPAFEPSLQIRRETWDTDADHHGYADGFGNRCERFSIPPGGSRLAYEAQVIVEQPHDVVEPGVRETPPAELPDETLSFILPSRFCLPDELGSEAWERFGDLAPGWGRVQSVVDFVHETIEFAPDGSNPWTTATDVLRARQGVCRDFAHLAISFCRALNIPSRYVFGYISSVGAPEPLETMDFAAWFEAYLDGRWHTFDARNNTPRIGRVVVGRGRDAADVALITSLGSLGLTAFTVTAEPA